MTTNENGRSTSPKPLDDLAIRKIGQKLREDYQQMASEPVPDRFAALLDALEKSEKPGKSDE